MMCLSCGNISTAYPASIAARKGFRCSQCPPEYYFTIKDEIATGILPNGEKFLIDADDLERLSSYYWRIGKDGYVVSGLCLLERTQRRQTLPDKTAIQHPQGVGKKRKCHGCKERSAKNLTPQEWEIKNVHIERNDS